MASVAVSTTGMYSGRQPAITALAAILPTVISRRRSGRSPITSPDGLPVRSMNSATRGLGGRDDGQSVRPAKLVAALDGLQRGVPLYGCSFADITQWSLAPVQELSPWLFRWRSRNCSGGRIEHRSSILVMPMEIQRLQNPLCILPSPLTFGANFFGALPSEWPDYLP